MTTRSVLCVRFANGNTSMTSSTFGKVASTLNEPRRLRLGAKFQV